MCCASGPQEREGSRCCHNIRAAPSTDESLGPEAYRHSPEGHQSCCLGRGHKIPGPRHIRATEPFSATPIQSSEICKQGSTPFSLLCPTLSHPHLFPSLPPLSPPLPDLTARDGAFTGKYDKTLALLHSDGYGLTLLPLPEPLKSPEEIAAEEEAKAEKESQEAGGGAGGKEAGEDTTFTGFGLGSRFDEVTDEAEKKQEEVGGEAGAVQFIFETPVHRIFNTPQRE